MTPDEQNLDMLVAELDRENRLLRARNERLEKAVEQRKPWVRLDAADWNKIGYTTEFRRGADWADAILREKNQ